MLSDRTAAATGASADSQHYYDSLGVTRVVNAAGNLTVLGGSVPGDTTVAAMTAALRDFVDIAELQDAVHARLAALTRNQAAYVTSSAAAGLYLATAAAVSAHYGAAIETLSWDDIHACDVLVHRGCRTAYDWAVRQVGVRLVDYGYPNAMAGTGLDELRTALGRRSAVAVLHAPGGWNTAGTPSLHDVAAIARDAGVPLVVDAAAQLPPTSNLWALTEAGAQLAIFSGGKGLRAPQASALMLGSGPVMEQVAALGFPRHGIGRMFKVGREQLAGVLAAVQTLLSEPDEVRLARAEEQVTQLLEMLAQYPNIRAERGFPNIAGQPLPYVLVRCPDPTRLAVALATGEPAIRVGEIPGHVGTDDGFILNTLALRDGDVSLIATAFAAALH